MSEKTISQKIARVFEIVDYVLLVPALAGLFFGVAMFSDKSSLPFGLAICAVFTIGTLLLVGYFKHSRGRLSEKKTIALWVGTIAFNALFLLPALYSAVREMSFRMFFGGGFLQNMLLSPYGLMILWWAIAVGGSIVALKDIRANQKYR